MKIAEFTLSGLSGSTAPGRKHSLGAEFSLGELAASDGSSVFTKDEWGPYGDVESGAWETLFVRPAGTGYQPKQFNGANPWDPPQTNLPLAQRPQGLPWSPMETGVASLQAGGNIEPVQTSTGDNWAEKMAKVAAATQGEPDPLKVTLSPAVLKELPADLRRKAAEVANGGFIGGVVGTKAKAVREQMLLKAEQAKHLDEAADQQFTASEAARMRGEANKVKADVIEDRARVERFRAASLMKVYQLIKEFEAGRQQKLANFAAPDAQYRHLAEAKAHANLAKKAEEKYNELLTKPLDVPGLDQAKREAMVQVDERFEIQRDAGVPGEVYGKHYTENPPLPTVVKGVAHPPVTAVGFPAEQRYGRSVVSFLGGLDAGDFDASSFANMPKSVDAAVAAGSGIVGAGASLVGFIGREAEKEAYQKYLNKQKLNGTASLVEIASSDQQVDLTSESGQPTGTKAPGVKISVRLAYSKPVTYRFVGAPTSEFPGTNFVIFKEITGKETPPVKAATQRKDKNKKTWVDIVVPYQSPYSQTYVVVGKEGAIGAVGKKMFSAGGAVQAWDDATGAFVAVKDTAEGKASEAKRAMQQADCEARGGRWSDASRTCKGGAPAPDADGGGMGDNTVLYIAGGVGAIALIGAGVYIYKKRKANKPTTAMQGYYGRRGRRRNRR